MNKIILIIIVIAVVAVGVFIMQNKDSVQPILNTVKDNTIVVSGNNKLDLSGQGLTSIPSYVFGKTNLSELNVSHNNLTGAIQAEIRHLGNLKILNASYNQMTGVPAEVGQLQKLEILDLSYNQLTGLPNELGNLKNLKTLNLAGNSYSQQDLDQIRAKLPNTNFILK